MTKHKKSAPKKEEFASLNAGILDCFLTEEESVEENKVQCLPLDRLRAAKWQPRRYFDPEKIADLASSFQTHGFRGTVNVRPVGEGMYEIIAGERRYRAAQQAKLTEIACVIDDYTDEQALEFSLVENLVREELSKLEETEGILDLIALKLGKQKAEVVQLIHSDGHSRRLKGRSISPNSLLGQIVSILDRLGVDLQLFRTKNLTLLNLASDLKQAHLTGDLSYTKALELNKIKEPLLRKKLLKQAITQQWSFSEVKDQVRVARDEGNPVPVGQAKRFLQRMTVARKTAQKSQLWHDYEKVARLEKLLSDIEKMLADAA